MFAVCGFSLTLFAIILISSGSISIFCGNYCSNLGAVAFSTLFFMIFLVSLVSAIALRIVAKDAKDDLNFLYKRTEKIQDQVKSLNSVQK